jgi:hypothetical protein
MGKILIYYWDVQKLFFFFLFCEFFKCLSLLFTFVSYLKFKVFCFKHIIQYIELIHDIFAYV